ncbi:hypothetical protein [Pseudonocardia adelaidensis]|uniref:hypothetical protein n=1 Tax=Pseudonocardia adelaidensis TaxID=648754 RepID=UPI0031EBFD2C
MSVLLVVVGLIAGCAAPAAGMAQPAGADRDGEAGALILGALQNAARQQRLRVAMFRETFATKADADARRNVETFTSSVSEVDTERGRFRSVWANNILQDGFSVGRCVDGRIFKDYYKAESQRASTLAQAATRLKLLPAGDLFEVTQPLRFVTCPHLGLLPASPPLAMSRLSDGVFPVTLNDKQAANWAEQVRAAHLFNYRDEGVVTWAGAAFRKISFAPRDADFTVNQTLYDVFRAAGEIDRITAEHPTAEVAYEFQSINPLNSGGVGGYYLMDEMRNLPVYSELQGTNLDRPDAASVDHSKRSGGAATHNIARTRQTYAYPMELTLDIDSPLELLE